MDYEQKYKEALERARELKNKLEKSCSLATPTGIESIFPELGENEDERIRKTLREIIIDYDPNNEILIKEVGVSQKQFLTWLEKQGEKSTIIDVDQMVTDYSYTKDGEFGLPVNCMIRAYRKGINDTLKLSLNLEKQTINRDKFAQDVLRGAAINLITWIDYNAAEGNICLSNMECEDIEDALVSGNWDKIYSYIKKKLEKQGEKKPTWSEEDEKIMKQIDSLLYSQCTIHSSMYEKFHNWLKSLKPQPHWKPTEEQMSCFKCVIDFYKTKVNDTIVLNLLDSLYEQLKKL